MWIEPKKLEIEIGVLTNFIDICKLMQSPEEIAILWSVGLFLFKTIIFNTKEL